MSITFTGKENVASNWTMNLVPKDSNVSFKLMCTLNNDGKKDLYDFEPILDEFKYSKFPDKNKNILIEVTDELSKKDQDSLIDIVRKSNGKKQESTIAQLTEWFKKEYKPHCLGIKINEKPVAVFKNNNYIFKKLQNLVIDISKRPIDLLLQKNTLGESEILDNMFGNYKIGGNTKKMLLECKKTENVLFNSDLIAKSLQDVITKISGKRVR